MTFRKITVFLLVLCLLSGLDGCGMKQADENTSSLWVVTEVSCSDGMNLQAEIIAKRMEKEHPGLTVRLDILPTDPQEREITLKQLRTKIMSGNSPDVFLLPTGNTLTTDYTNEHLHRLTRNTEIEPLFLDVSQAMRSGQFLDLTTFYDGDPAVDTAALKREIMDAGTVGNRRYVLPLRFNIPVICTDPKLWDNYGISREKLTSGGPELVWTLLERADSAPICAGVQLPADLTLLSDAFDYGQEQLLLSPKTLADYMRLYQRWRSAAIPGEQMLLQAALTETMSYVEDPMWKSILEEPNRDLFRTIRSYNTLSNYVCEDIHWSTKGFPLFSCSMADSLESLAVAKTYESIYGEKRELFYFPWRDSGGAVTANVTYWGAVGSGTIEPELSYGFLRQFLDEEFQWDTYRPKQNDSGKRPQAEVQCAGQVENSWPVRTSGSAAALWETLRYQNRKIAFSGRKESHQIGAAARALSFRDSDIPALSWDIDEVRFPVTISGTDSLEYALSQLNEPDGTPTDADIEALAQQVYQGLWWHLAEG